MKRFQYDSKKNKHKDFTFLYGPFKKFDNSYSLVDKIVSSVPSDDIILAEQILYNTVCDLANDDIYRSPDKIYREKLETEFMNKVLAKFLYHNRISALDLLEQGDVDTRECINILEYMPSIYEEKVDKIIGASCTQEAFANES